ncbi:glycosyltransferase family 4 protein [bacterium]|nr:glycosyltransferase family 4 protein [bacterium]
MSEPLEHVVIDARMLSHSGIGTALRGLLHAWDQAPPPFRLTLLGDLKLLDAQVPGSLKAEFMEFDLPIYSPVSFLSGAPTGDAQVFLSPHYTAPLRVAQPVVAIVHDLIHVTHPPRRGTASYMKVYLAELRRRASFIVTPSRHTKVQLQTLHGFDAHRVLTLPWGPGIIGLTKPEDLPPDALPGGDFILAVGINKPHKNWGFLLERLAGLWKSGRLEIPLAAAGLDEEGREALATRAAELDVPGWVSFVPHVTDGQMASLYKKARVLAFCSLVEGFGFPVLEAMASGTPAIVTDLAPMNEIAGDAGLLFDPDDGESFDEALIQAATNDDVRERCRERGLEQAKRFRWEKIARQMEEVLERTHAE